MLQRFDFFGLNATPPPVTYTSTKSATASCPAGTTGPGVSGTETRTSTVSQADADAQAQNAANAAATAALVCTVVAGPAPSFNTTLNPGESADVVTWNGAAGTQFKFNAPLPAGDPAPATMLVFLAGNQVGQADYNGNVTGTACAVVVNGTTYQTTFQNGNVNLS